MADREITYYGLYGLNERDYKFPSGMMRVISEPGKLWYERIDGKGNWIFDSELVRHMMGYSDEAEEITEELAKEYIEYIKSGKMKEDRDQDIWI